MSNRIQFSKSSCVKNSAVHPRSCTGENKSRAVPCLENVLQCTCKHGHLFFSFIVCGSYATNTAFHVDQAAAGHKWRQQDSLFSVELDMQIVDYLISRSAEPSNRSSAPAG